MKQKYKRQEMEQVQGKKITPSKQQGQNSRQITEHSEMTENDIISKNADHDYVQNEDQPRRKVDLMHQLYKKSKEKSITKCITMSA